MKNRLASAVVVVLALAGTSAGQAFTTTLSPEARALWERAGNALVVGDTAAGHKEAERLVALAPDYARGYELLAAATPETGRAALADRYRRLAEAEPRRAALWYAYGSLTPDAAAATSAFQKVVEDAPSAPWGWLGLARAAARSKDFARAFEAVEKARAVAPSEPAVVSAYAALVESYVNANPEAADTATRTAEALARFNTLRAAAPRSYDAALAAAALVRMNAESSVCQYYVDTFPTGDAAGWAHVYLLMRADSKDSAAVEAKARAALAKLVGLRAGGSYAAREMIFDRFVLGSVSARGRAALDALAAEMLGSKEDLPEIFVALGGALAKAGAEPAALVRIYERGFEFYEKTPAHTTDDREAEWWLGVGDQLRLELGRAYVGVGDHKRGAGLLAAVRGELYVGDASFAAARAYAKIGEQARALDASVLAAAIVPKPEYLEALAAAAKAAGRPEAEVERALWAARDARARPAADFSLADLDGKPAALADYRGKVLVLNFWFPMCGPCRKEFPHIQKFYESRRDRGVEVVAIDVTSNDVGARRFFAEKGITVRSLRGSWEQAREQYGVNFAPTTFVVDQRGRVMFKHVGFSGPEDVEQIGREVDALLDRAKR